MADSEIELPQILDHLYDWCSNWLLELNASKTQMMHFRKKHKRKTNIEFKYGGNMIEVVEKYTYLGVVQSYGCGIDICCKQGLGTIISKTRNIRNCDYYTVTKLFQSGVFLVLEWGSGILGFKPYKTENIGNCAMLYFLGLNRFAPLHALHGDMGWKSILIKEAIAIKKTPNNINQDES